MARISQKHVRKRENATYSHAQGGAMRSAPDGEEISLSPEAQPTSYLIIEVVGPWSSAMWWPVAH